MKPSVDLNAPVYLLKGDDDVLREDAVLELVHALVGGGARTLMVEELDAARFDHDGELLIAPLVDAAQTPPFLTDRRVVVGRQVGGFSKTDQVAPLIDYLADPLDSTSLVLVWEKVPKPGAKLAAIPAKLLDAVKKAGGVIVETKIDDRARAGWIDEQLKHASVKLDAPARKLIEERIGEDASLLVGLLPLLEGVYGAGAKVGADELAPYLGVEGGVKGWDLTDAIDAGDVARALGTLQRMLTGSGSGLHPLVVMASLTNHYTRMLALDGAGVGDEKAAAELLGFKKGASTFPAKKALAQTNRLGSERLAEFVRLLAQADLDLKGAKAWPPELVVEVLVARLASRTPRASSRGPARVGRR